MFMYYYYYRASFMRYRPWWRSLITKGQIVQFIFGAVTAITWYGTALCMLWLG